MKLKEDLHVLAALYHRDETAWLELMAKLVAERRFDEVDCNHLAEFLINMAKQDRRETVERLTNLLTELLRWHYLPVEHTSIWQSSLTVLRRELLDALESDSLRHHAQEQLAKAYDRAREIVRIMAQVPLDTFPAECPWSLREISEED